MGDVKGWALGIPTSAPPARILTFCTVCKFCMECKAGGMIDSCTSARSRRTRQDIHRAALALAAEHPVQDITVERIAEAADVSRRTFFNHFATKNDAFVPDIGFTSPQVLSGFAAGTNPDLLGAVEEVLRTRADHLGTVLDDGGASLRVIHENPELLPLLQAQVRGFETDLRHAMAVRAGIPETSPQAMAVANLVTSLERSILESWRTAPGGTPLGDLVAPVVEGLREALLP